jgi:hypothetical protein
LGSFGRWEKSFFAQRRSNGDGIRIIQVEYCNRYTAHSRLAHEIGALPAKVPSPRMSSWVKERCEFPRSRIDASDVRAFVAVTVEARER